MNCQYIKKHTKIWKILTGTSLLFRNTLKYCLCLWKNFSVLFKHLNVTVCHYVGKWDLGLKEVTTIFLGTYHHWLFEIMQSTAYTLKLFFFLFPTSVNCPTFVSMFNQCSITSPVNSKWMSARVVAYFLQWVESTVVTLSVCRSRQQPSCLFTVLCCRTIWKALVHVSMTWEDIELTHIHFLQSYFNPSILTPDPPNTVVFGKFYI